MSVRGIRRSVRRRRMYQHQARLYQQMYQQFPPTNHIGAGMICYADSRRTAENPYFTRLYKERQRSSGKWSDLRRGVNGAQGRNRTTDTMIFSHVDRKSVVRGKSVSVRVDPGGRRIIKKKQKQTN